MGFIPFRGVYLLKIQHVEKYLLGFICTFYPVYVLGGGDFHVFGMDPVERKIWSRFWHL